MKQFNRMIIGVIGLWLLLSCTYALWMLQSGFDRVEKGYLIEVNRIQDFFIRTKTFTEIDLSDYNYMKQLDYLPVYPGSNAGQEQRAFTEAFFEGKGLVDYSIKGVMEGFGYTIRPFFIDDELKGYLRFAYGNEYHSGMIQQIILAEVLLGVLFLAITGILIYIRNAVIAPFHEISELPYELAKGHLPKAIGETKNRYFGKFLWGLNLLRESLEEHKQKGLRLEKDKKLMILSVSHDIKTPLSTIKLYSKALYEELYTSEEKKHETARKIEEKADQIEHFITEIIITSSTELFEFEVVNREFYISSLIETLKRTYEEKLDLLKIDFVIGHYLDKLLKGDFEKLIDVFDNLFQNAIKYGDGKEITLTFEEEDNCQLIRITNTGLPLPASHMHHMFESFWRGENALEKPGNGLGLYICKQLMKKMEGEIFAEAGDHEMSFVVVLRKS